MTVCLSRLLFLHLFSLDPENVVLSCLVLCSLFGLCFKTMAWLNISLKMRTYLDVVSLDKSHFKILQFCLPYVYLDLYSCILLLFERG